MRDEGGSRHGPLQDAHAGKEYFFCCAGCLTKFQANPEGTVGAAKADGARGWCRGCAGAVAPQRGHSASAPPAARPSCTQRHGAANRYARLRLSHVPGSAPGWPGAVSKVRHGVEPESPALAATKTEYTCPMHPEIVRTEPGTCPICGMALEPRTVAVEEENPELRDMTRRFWISLVLTAPLLAIAMGSMIWPHAFMGDIAVVMGIVTWGHR